jgi:hypothetical protein
MWMKDMQINNTILKIVFSNFSLERKNLRLKLLHLFLDNNRNNKETEKKRHQNSYYLLQK